MRRFFALYAVAAITFLALDAVWLSLMGSRLYRPMIGHLMRPDFDIAAAAAFYLLYLLGLVVFVLWPAGPTARAAASGGLFGLVAYGTYDLTNQATLQGWPWAVTLADLCWGTFATAAASAVAHRVAGRR